MKAFYLFAFSAISAVTSAQTEDSCSKFFLFSRELFPESLNLKHTIALRESEEACESQRLLTAARVETGKLGKDRFRYWQEFRSRQTPDGFERLYIPTEELVERILYRHP